ncbi:Uncharacterised protein [Escherichia coli]|nr:Uncharacterised protein [Escherichia coli]
MAENFAPLNFKNTIPDQLSITVSGIAADGQKNGTPIAGAPSPKPRFSRAVSTVPSDLISPNGFLRLRYSTANPDPSNSTKPGRSPLSSTSRCVLSLTNWARAAAIKLACRITLLTCALDAFPAVNPDKSAGNASHSSCDITLAFRSVANALKSFFAIRVILPMPLHQNH